MIYEEKSFHQEFINDPELHQKIIDALPIPIFYRDVKGVYKACNVAQEKLFGMSKSQIIGKVKASVQNWRSVADRYKILKKVQDRMSRAFQL